jgi:hypothetical protein
MLPVFADPKTVFKRIFGAEARKPLPIALLKLDATRRIWDVEPASRVGFDDSARSGWRVKRRLQSRLSEGAD